MNYINTLKRIRLKKTNYRKRASLLLSKKLFITIKVSNQNIISQILEPIISGDKVLVSVHSKNLVNFGWKGSLNSIPACYLTGYLLSKKAKNSKNINETILYLGKNSYTEKVASCLKGIIDGGINIPSSSESFPDDERITGKHISNYALLLKSSEKYNKIFATILSNGLKPEEYPNHFNEIKGIIDKTDFSKLNSNKTSTKSEKTIGKESEDNIKPKKDLVMEDNTN
ncbi:MAG: 50S ribosomal protein L18 [Nitrososphaeraceae archaeon]